MLALLAALEAGSAADCFLWDSNIWGCGSPPLGMLFFPRPFSLQREPQNLNAGLRVCVTARLTEHMLSLTAHCDCVCLGESRRVCECECVGV